MNISLVIAIITRDREGLVENVASLIASCEGNWVESRMCHLGGRFAGVLRVFLPATSRDKLIARLDELSSADFHYTVEEDDSPAPPAHRQLARFEILGHDRPGIVRDIASALAEHHVNLEELNSEFRTAPWSGDILFFAEALISIPSSTSLETVESALQDITSDLMVDLKFEPTEMTRWQ